MSAADVSHLILWSIGGMAVLAAVTSFGAMFAMGRSSYRKN